MKFVVYYKKERAGRLFDFYEGRDKKFSFDFGQMFGGEISTEKLTDVDDLISKVFTTRVSEFQTSTKKVLTAKAA